MATIPVFYKNLRDLCEERGLTVNELARLLGLSTGSPTAWKNGTVPREATLNKIADYFGVSTDYLLGKEEKEKPLINDDEELTEYVEMLKNRPECRMLFQLSKNATKEDVEAAVRIIEALRK